MSGVEEQLVRDIAAVTGGVVVTDSDLRIARARIDERVERRHRQERRLVAVVAAAAAVVLLVAGLLVVQSLGSDTRTAPPADRGPTQADPFVDFLHGEDPTPELVQGVWRLDNGGVLMRFAPPDVVSFDRGGRLFGNPSVQGTYSITDDRITITVEGGPAGCGGQQIGIRASVPKPGTMHFIHTRPGTGSCSTAQDESWVMEQVLPTSAGIRNTVFSTETGWKPLVDGVDLAGSWFAEGGDYVLELEPSGAYHVAAGAGEQVDQGDWSRDASRLTFTSRPDSVECSASDQLELVNVEYVDPQTIAIRSTVRTNDCAVPWADSLWIRIPDDSTP